MSSINRITIQDEIGCEIWERVSGQIYLRMFDIEDAARLTINEMYVSQTLFNETSSQLGEYVENSINS